MNSVYVINNDNTNYKDDEYKILKWSERERKKEKVLKEKIDEISD